MKLIALISIAVLFLGCCGDKRDSWLECNQKDHKDPIKGSYLSKILGTVTVDNGDECKIEEISRVNYTCRDNSNWEYDDKLQCKYCAADTAPVARRLICKSGTITTNTITYTNDKFHSELIH